MVHYPNDLSSNEETKRLSPTTETANGTRRLQDEINTLTKRNCGKYFACLWRSCIWHCLSPLLNLFLFIAELENQLKVLEQLQNQGPDLKIISMEGESSSRVRELEKMVRMLQQDRDEALKVFFSPLIIFL